MIDQADVDLICLTDDLEYVASEIERSLNKQINILEDEGLEDTTYFKSLKKFFD